MQAIDPCVAERIRHLFAQMHTPTDTSIPVSQMPLHFRASQQDIAQMLLAGVIVPVQLTLGELPPGSVTYYFSVAEHAKHRRRPIMWPKAFLLTSAYQSEFSLGSAEEYVRAVHDGVSAVTFDLAASFWQVLLPAQTQLYIVGVDQPGLSHSAPALRHRRGERDRPSPRLRGGTPCRHDGLGAHVCAHRQCYGSRIARRHCCFRGGFQKPSDLLRNDVE
jgi:hypothetical protein